MKTDFENFEQMNFAARWNGGAAKHQHPTSNFQRSFKHQAPSSDSARGFEALNLVLLWSLDVGAWCFIWSFD
jgi:hypothetical protein